MPLGSMKVRLGLCHIVLHGDPVPLKGAQQPPSFWPMSVVAMVAHLNPNGKGPRRSRDCKGPLGTAKDCKELRRILNLVVILSNITLIHLLAAA